MQIINFLARNYFSPKFKLLLILIFSMLYCIPAFANSANKFSEREMYDAKDVPDTNFFNVKGEEINLAHFKGKTIILNFWATWCGPCIEEMPALDKLQSQLNDNYVIIAISEDFKGLEKVEQFYNDEKIVHLGKYTDKKNHLMNAFKVIALPTTIIINKDMKEIGRISGYVDWSVPNAREFINQLQ